MANYYAEIKGYAMTLGLTTGLLWLTGGVLGVYLSKGTTMLLLSAVITGGLPVLTTFIAAKFNILGSLILILEAVLILLLIYSEGANLLILIVLCLSYSLPIILSGIAFISYWYKNKTRI